MGPQIRDQEWFLLENFLLYGTGAKIFTFKLHVSNKIFLLCYVIGGFEGLNVQYFDYLIS